MRPAEEAGWCMSQLSALGHVFLAPDLMLLIIMTSLDVHVKTNNNGLGNY